MRVIWFATMLATSAAVTGPVEAEVPALFGELEAGVSALPVAPAMKAALLDLVGAAQAHWGDGVTSPLAVVDLLQSVTTQLAELLLVVTNDEPILSLILKSDQVCAEVFFESGPLVASLPPLPEPPPQQCTVRILTRLIGPVLNDPAGILYLRFAQLVQFEAQASEEGDSSTGSYRRHPNCRSYTAGGPACPCGWLIPLSRLESGFKKVPRSVPT